MALIQQDLVPGSGDQLLTLDTDTHLQWLNLTATANRSYLEVMGGFGNFIGTYGFQYGDVAQVGTLFVHAGITKETQEPRFISSPNDLVNHYGVQTLQELMNGRTLLPSIVSGTTPASFIIQTQGMFKPPVPFPSPDVVLDGFTTSLSILTPVNSYATTSPMRKPGVADPHVASYLVRAAP